MTQQNLIKPPRRLKRALPVRLTEAELSTVAKEIGRLNRERDDMRAKAKMVASQWKDRISGFDSQIADLAAKADAGVEDRDVECEEIYDYRLGEVRVERLDTRAVLEVRPMTAAERQPELFDTSAGDVDDDEGSEGDLVDVGAREIVDDEPDVADEDEDGTDVTDPQAVLDAAPAGEEAKPKRGRKKGTV